MITFEINTWFDFRNYGRQFTNHQLTRINLIIMEAITKIYISSMMEERFNPVMMNNKRWSLLRAFFFFPRSHLFHEVGLMVWQKTEYKRRQLSGAEELGKH